MMMMILKAIWTTLTMRTTSEMKTIWIATNGRPSNGAKALSSQPGFRRLRTGKGVKAGDVIVNWGSSQPYDFDNKLIINPPAAVKFASNKLDFFSYLFGPESENPIDGVFVKTPDWTTDKLQARLWQKEGGHTIVARQKLTGHSGEGIIIVEPGELVPDAPLYTKYIFKEKEYRVHVCNGAVIDTQRKIKDPSREVVTWKVRSHQNGFIYARNGLEPDLARDNLAVATCKSIGLHFGAVDIIQDKKGTYYVLEVNTAPGLEGQTVEQYAKAFRGAVGNG